MQPYDLALIAGLIVICSAGWGGGFALTTVFALVLAGGVAVGVLFGTANAMLIVLGAWAVAFIGSVALLRRLRRRRVSRRSSFTAFLPGAAAFAVFAVAGTGALQARYPEVGDAVSRAAAYPVVARAGSGVAEAAAATNNATPVLAYAAPISKPTPAPPEPGHPRPIEWATVAMFDNRIERILTGSSVASDSVPLSFSIAGTVVAVHVALGEMFKEGQVLAELDPTSLELALEERRAALIEASAVAREAELPLDRQSQLAERGTVSEAALDRAQLAADTAESRLEQIAS